MKAKLRLSNTVLAGVLKFSAGPVGSESVLKVPRVPGPIECAKRSAALTQSWHACVIPPQRQRAFRRPPSKINIMRPWPVVILSVAFEPNEIILLLMPVRNLLLTQLLQNINECQWKRTTSAKIAIGPFASAWPFQKTCKLLWKL